MLKSRKLKYKKNNVTNTLYAYDESDFSHIPLSLYVKSPTLRIRSGSSFGIIPAITGKGSGINYKKGAIYHCVSVPPRIYVSMANSSSSVTVSGTTITTYVKKITGVWLTCPIAKKVEVYAGGEKTSNQTLVTTINIGTAYVANLSKTYSDTSSKLFFTVKIDGVTVSTTSLSGMGNYNTIISDIDEKYFSYG